MVYEKVCEVILSTMYLDESILLSEDTNLKDDLAADSLDAVEILMGLESAFDIEIIDEEAEKLRTIGDIVNYIESRI
ncbi:MAG: acyl carrier protein [Oscillospiraceae bacterium]|nr:acyl carrier protein [Oscillospiraceae bacterium]